MIYKCCGQISIGDQNILTGDRSIKIECSKIIPLALYLMNINHGKLLIGVTLGEKIIYMYIRKTVCQNLKKQKWKNAKFEELCQIVKFTSQVKCL